MGLLEAEFQELSDTEAAKVKTIQNRLIELVPISTLDFVNGD